MTKILITGANGLVGSHLVEEFAGTGFEINCLVHNNLDYISAFPAGRIKVFKGSITEPDSLAGAVKGVDYIFHSAAVLRARNTAAYFAVNHQGTKNLLESALKNAKNLKRFIYISSQAALGPCETKTCKRMDAPPSPVSDYGRSKLKGEEEAMNFKDRFPVMILRPSAIYGPRDKDLFPFFRFASKGFFPIITGDGECMLQPLFVKDLAEICLLAVTKNTVKDKIYFISEEKMYSWNDIYAAVGKVAGRKVVKISVPRPVSRAAALLSEKIAWLVNRPAVLNTQKLSELCHKYWLGDVSDTKNDFDFNFTNFEIGAKITYNWYKENGWL